MTPDYVIRTIMEMNLRIVSKEVLASMIQHRAREIAAGEGYQTDIPRPGISQLREPPQFGQHWELADFQNARGLGAIRIAAAELSCQYDIEREADLPRS